MFIDRIVAAKRLRVEQAKERLPLDGLAGALESDRGVGGSPAASAPRAGASRAAGAFESALLSSPRPALIAEVKKASPSRGLIREDFDPAEIARAYEEGGAAAISVLTEEDFFLGSPAHLSQVRGSTVLPVLRKDFMIDEYQLYESRFMGADAVLLITAVLGERLLRRFLEVSRVVGLECLVEVHTREELDIALSAGCRMLGINNRDLRDFRVDLTTTERLIPLVPPGVVVVSESGVRSRDDALRLAGVGAHAVLVGETLMKSDDIRARTMELSGRG